MRICKSIGCSAAVSLSDSSTDFCTVCATSVPPQLSIFEDELDSENIEISSNASLSKKYPKYYKPVNDQTEIDVYAVHHMFQIQDPSGCIQHASKKLLLSGVRTGGKSAYKDIKEARDTLTRWLQLNQNQ